MAIGPAFARTLTASDPDAGDVLTFALVAGPAGMTLSGADLNWSTVGRNPGDYAVTVKVSDPAGSFDQKTFTVTLAAIGAGAGRGRRHLRGAGRRNAHRFRAGGARQRLEPGRQRHRCTQAHRPDRRQPDRVRGRRFVRVPGAGKPAGRPAGDNQDLERQRDVVVRRARGDRRSQRRRLSRRHQPQPQRRHPGAFGAGRRGALGTGRDWRNRLPGDDRGRDEPPRARRHRRQRSSRVRAHNQVRARREQLARPASSRSTTWAR